MFLQSTTRFCRVLSLKLAFLIFAGRCRVGNGVCVSNQWPAQQPQPLCHGELQMLHARGWGLGSKGMGAGCGEICCPEPTGGAGRALWAVVIDRGHLSPLFSQLCQSPLPRERGERRENILVACQGANLLTLLGRENTRTPLLTHPRIPLLTQDAQKLNFANGLKPRFPS